MTVIDRTKPSNAKTKRAQAPESPIQLVEPPHNQRRRACFETPTLFLFNDNCNHRALASDVSVVIATCLLHDECDAARWIGLAAQTSIK